MQRRRSRSSKGAHMKPRGRTATGALSRARTERDLGVALVVRRGLGLVGLCTVCKDGRWRVLWPTTMPVVQPHLLMCCERAVPSSSLCCYDASVGNTFSWWLRCVSEAVGRLGRSSSEELLAGLGTVLSCWWTRCAHNEGLVPARR